MSQDKKTRVLLAKLGCDTHDRGAMTLLTILRNAGMEVIYTGRFQTPKGVANAAISEDVDVIALTDHTGSLPIIAKAVIDELNKLGVTDMKIVSGGLLGPDDAKELEKLGVTGNYGPGTPLKTIVEHFRSVAA